MNKSSEKRTLERLQPYYYLRVYDNSNNSYIGSVSDISKKGLCIASDRKFQKDGIFELCMLLPEDGILGDKVVVKAKVIWCKKNLNDDSYAIGFEYDGNVDSGIHIIGKLLSDLKHKKLV